MPINKYINKVCSNTSTDSIEITEDKLRLILKDFISDVKKNTGWISPLTSFISIFLILLTADVKEFLGIHSETWLAFVGLLTIASFIWFIVKIIYFFKYKERSSINYIVRKIKNSD